MLFVDGADIAEPIVAPRPRAAEALGPLRALLAAAEAVSLDSLDRHTAGRTVLVGGERRPREALLVGDALLDDGTAVVPLVFAARAPHSLRSALTARYVLVTGMVREIDGTVAIEPHEVADLRVLAREWVGRQ